MSHETPSDRLNMACVILAGGRSRRFGSNKAFAEFRGARLVDHLIQRLAAQSSGPIAVNAPESAGQALGDCELAPDQIDGDVGPLAGLHAALFWAAKSGFDAVITSPVDTPILPGDFIARLVAAGAPSVASHKGRTHALHGFWPTSLCARLEAEIGEGMRSARDWCAAIAASDCVFTSASDQDPFFNVNTPEDLARLASDHPVSPR